MFRLKQISCVTTTSNIGQTYKSSLSVNTLQKTESAKIPLKGSPNHYHCEAKLCILLIVSKFQIQISKTLFSLELLQNQENLRSWHQYLHNLEQFENPQTKNKIVKNKNTLLHEIKL